MTDPNHRTLTNLWRNRKLRKMEEGFEDQEFALRFSSCPTRFVEVPGSFERFVALSVDWSSLDAVLARARCDAELVVPAIPSLDFVASDNKTEDDASTLLFQRPLVKCTHGPIEGWKSGTRSALLRDGDKVYRLKVKKRKRVKNVHPSLLKRDVETTRPDLLFGRMRKDGVMFAVVLSRTLLCANAKWLLFLEVPMFLSVFGTMATLSVEFNLVASSKRHWEIADSAPTSSLVLKYCFLV